MTARYIFIVFTNFGLGGIQRKILDIVNELSREKDIYPILIFKDKKKFNFEKSIKNPRAKVVYPRILITDNKYCNFVAFTLTIFRLFLRYKPNSILAFHHYSLLSVAFAPFLRCISKTKLILSQDNILSLYNRKEYTGFALPKLFLRWLYIVADTIIVQTVFAKRDLIATLGAHKNKIVVIPNWVSLAPPNSKKAQVKRTTDIVYVGRFEKQKNLGQFLTIVSDVAKKKEIKTLMMGDGKQKKEVTTLAKKVRHTTIYIQKPGLKVQSVLRKSKLFLLTSKFEGMPMALLEAMSQGVVPCVLESPGMSEYIKPGVSGIVTKTPSQLTQKVLWLLNNPSELEKLSFSAREFVAKYFSKANLQKTLEIMTEFGEKSY